MRLIFCNSRDRIIAIAFLTLTGHAMAADSIPFVVKTKSASMQNGIVTLGGPVPVWRVEDNVEAKEDNQLLKPQSPEKAKMDDDAPALPSKAATTIQLAQIDPLRIHPVSSDAGPQAIVKPMQSIRTNEQVNMQSGAKVAIAPTVNVEEVRSTQPNEPATLKANTTKFSVTSGDLLSAALNGYLKSNGMTMQWNTRSDFVIQHTYALDGDKYQDVLKNVLSSYGLSATVWEGNNVVEIYTTNGEAKQ